MSKEQLIPNITEEFTSRVQEVIFWRRPLISLFFSIVINLIIFLIYYLDLSFLATVGFLGLIGCVLRLFCSNAFNFMFRKQINDNAKSPNRIRSLKELNPKFQRFNRGVKKIKKWFEEYVRHPTLKKNFIFFGFSALSFITAETIGTVFLFWILIDSVLFITPLFVNPKINEFIKNHFQTK